MTPTAARNLKIGAIVAAVVIALDQATKAWALATLFVDGRIVAVMPSFNLVAVWNRGVSFGLLASDAPATPYLLAAFAIAVAAGMTVWLARAETRLARIGLALVVGGALGNVIDRFRFHAVVDFIDLYWGPYHWPAFNVADSAITIGVVALLLDSIGGGGERPKESADRTAASPDGRGRTGSSE